MGETLFTRIIRGEIPCHRLFEDDHVLAFLDIAPLAAGHALLVPKRPVATMDQLDAASAAALGRALPPLCRAVMRATGTKAYNLLQNNGALAHQDVPHLHVHIIPRPSAAEGLDLVWRPGALAPEVGRRLSAAIVALLDEGAP